MKLFYRIYVEGVEYNQYGGITMQLGMLKEHIAEQLHLEMQEIACIAYRNEDIGIEGRRFKHIDVELTYGEYIELTEEDVLYQVIYKWCKLAETENVEEVILFQTEG